MGKRKRNSQRNVPGADLTTSRRNLLGYGIAGGGILIAVAGGYILSQNQPKRTAPVPKTSPSASSFVAASTTAVPLVTQTSTGLRPATEAHSIADVVAGISTADSHVKYFSENFFPLKEAIASGYVSGVYLYPDHRDLITEVVSRNYHSLGRTMPKNYWEMGGDFVKNFHVSTTLVYIDDSGVIIPSIGKRLPVPILVTKNNVYSPKGYIKTNKDFEHIFVHEISHARRSYYGFEFDHNKLREPALRAIDELLAYNDELSFIYKYQSSIPEDGNSGLGWAALSLTLSTFAGFYLIIEALASGKADTLEKELGVAPAMKLIKVDDLNQFIASSPAEEKAIALTQVKEVSRFKAVNGTDQQGRFIEIIPDASLYSFSPIKIRPPG